jgi:2-amino-4-hydroxy-6-hydroxymethyldihydropteridine diphosphokinase
MPPNIATAYLGLGSNEGDRQTNMGRALDTMEQEGARVRRVSSYYRTEPVEAKGPWFLNGVAEIEVPWTVRRLLAVCEEVEVRLGRRSKGDRAPRPVDLDILLYADLVMEEPGLAIPHPRLPLRRFVLLPLAELCPDLQVPGLGRTVQELLESCPDRSGAIRIDDDA